jgi:two-component system, OmpR family, sensor kinase
VAANLLANARQHTPPSATVRVGVRRDNGSVVLEVADDGPGLFPEEAAKVFERFYRADPSRNRNQGGTGLGLSIVAAVAEAHGGRARVESVPGHGARFWVELPSVAPAEGQRGDQVHADQFVERSLDVERVRRPFRRRPDGDLGHDG